MTYTQPKVKLTLPTTHVVRSFVNLVVTRSDKRGTKSLGRSRDNWRKHHLGVINWSIYWFWFLSLCKVCLFHCLTSSWLRGNKNQVSIFIRLQRGTGWVPKSQKDGVKERLCLKRRFVFTPYFKETCSWCFFFAFFFFLFPFVCLWLERFNLVYGVFLCAVIEACSFYNFCYDKWMWDL